MTGMWTEHVHFGVSIAATNSNSMRIPVAISLVILKVNALGELC